LPISLTRLLEFITLWIFFSVSPSYAEELVMSVGEYEPYIDSQATNQGFMTELVSEAYKRVGVDINLEFKPWKRVGSVDIDQENRVSFAWVKTESRLKKWLYSDPIVSDKTVLVARTDSNISWNTYADLKPYRVGVTSGYSYGDSFDNYKVNLSVEEGNTDLQNLRKVLYQRIELLVIGEYVGPMLVRKNFSTEQQKQFHFIVDPYIAVDRLHTVCAKNNERCALLIDQFNIGLELMKNDGTYARIVDHALGQYHEDE